MKLYQGLALITFKEFLNERLSTVKPTEKRKVDKKELRDMILNGESVEDVDYSHITDMSYMFNGCSLLEKIPNINTSNVTNMGSMFYNCSKLESIPKLDTSNVTNMAFMLCGCEKLESASLNTPKVESLERMFYGCSNLKSVFVSNTEGAYMEGMFEGCTNLEKINTNQFKEYVFSLNTHKKLFKKYKNVLEFEVY